MFAVGHFALGYILSKTTAQLTKTRLNIPLVLMLSIIPDIDILIPQLEHRGPFHSIIMATIVFIPVFVVYRKNALPYFIALIQHSLLSDFIAGGKTQLFWPITSQHYGIEMSIESPTNVTIELLAFLASMIIMLKTKDILVFLRPHYSNLILFIPTFTVLLPTFLNFPLKVPYMLLLPHITYLIFFLTSVLVTLEKS